MSTVASPKKKTTWPPRMLAERCLEFTNGDPLEALWLAIYATYEFKKREGIDSDRLFSEAD